jgi:hypothetical protein
MSKKIDYRPELKGEQPSHPIIMDRDGRQMIHSGGLTIRDEFAKSAMISLISSSEAKDLTPKELLIIVKNSYWVADRMLMEGQQK